MGFKVFFDRWGGGPILSPPPTSGTPATGLEIAPVIKTLPRKSSFVLSTSPLPGGISWVSSWVDTLGTGDIFVTLTITTQGSVNGVLQLFESDDPLNVLQTVLVNSITYSLGTSGSHVSGQIRKRFWRAQINTGTLTSLQLTATVSNFGTTAILGQGVTNTVSNQIPVSISSGGSPSDSAQVMGVFQPNGTSQPLAVAGYAFTTTPTVAASAIGLRTPNVFRGAQFSGTGANVIWTPPSTKKVRLMKYKIEVGEDATITSGPLPINLQFSEQLGTTTSLTLPYATLLPYTHRMVIPATVLATSFDGYDSGWVDLGNGVLLATSGRALTMGIQVPQPTTAITSPSWTIVSNQWEAATVGFKTNSALGNFKLVQQNTFTATASLVTAGAVQSITGNSYFVFFRTTNPVGGAPTVTVTDTAGNTYTTGTLVTNATDGTNGSSLGVAYVINAVGNAANVVTVTTTVNLATQIEVIYMEYAGLNSGGGIDATQVGATGNSTTPASGNYTPATVGDLVFTFMSTAANNAVQPTTPAAFVLRGCVFTGLGTLAVADNFGNGSLAAGQINVVCIGTEE